MQSPRLAFTPRYSAKALASPPRFYEVTTRYDFAVGHPDASAFPVEELADATLRMLQRESRNLALYPSEAIHRRTRELVSRKLWAEEPVSIPPERITITNGSMQGLTLLAEGFVDPGDTIIVEEFTYQGALRAFGSCQPRYATVATDDDGMVVDDLARVLDRLEAEGTPPRFAYVITNFQNPTGAVMSGARRRQLVELAAARELLVVEDDVYGDLIYDGEPEPSLYGLSPVDNIIRLGTFSKIVGAGVRLGWLIAPEPVLLQLLGAKIDGGTSAFSSLAIAEYLEGRVEQRVTLMHEIYRQKRDAMLDALDEHFTGLATWSRPRGGLFVWVRMPEGFDSVQRLPAANAAGVDYLPGSNFSPTGAGANFLRLSFAYLSPEDIRTGLAILADVLA